MESDETHAGRIANLINVPFCHIVITRIYEQVATVERDDEIHKSCLLRVNNSSDHPILQSHLYYVIWLDFDLRWYMKATRNGGGGGNEPSTRNIASNRNLEVSTGLLGPPVTSQAAKTREILKTERLFIKPLNIG